MDFNKKQRTILTVGIVVIILMGLFPPWTCTYTYKSENSKNPSGYAFIANPPEVKGFTFGTFSFELDISRLCLQWMIVLFATGLGVFLSRKSTLNRKKIIAWPWKKIAIRAAVVITSLILLAGIVLCGRYLYVKIAERPKVQKSYWDLTLDSTKEDIKFLKGTPTKEEKDSWSYKITEPYYPYKQTSYLIMFVNNKIWLISGEDSIQNIRQGDSYDEVIKRFGKQSCISYSKDGLIRNISFKEYDVCFVLQEGKVIYLGIYNPSLGDVRLKKEAKFECLEPIKNKKLFTTEEVIEEIKKMKDKKQ